MKLKESMDDMVPLAKVKGVQFDLLGKNEIKTLSVIPSISKTKELMDSRLGVPNQSQEQKCSTCTASNTDLCEGHFGSILLPRVIYNPNLIADIVDILNKICPSCLNVKGEKRKTNISTLFSILEEICGKEGKKSIHLENAGIYETKYQLQLATTDVEHASHSANTNGIPGDSAFINMVSSDDEDYSKTSECEKGQDWNGCNKQKSEITKKGCSPKCCNKFRTIPFTTRKLRQRKRGIQYSEISPKRQTLRKEELALEDLKNNATHISVATGKTSKQVHSTIISLEEETYSDRHSDTVVTNSQRKLSTSKHKADDRTKCAYCQTDVEATDNLYPPVKFRLASKNIHGKPISSIIMEIDLNTKGKFPDRDWSNYIAHDYWGFIQDLKQTSNGEVQMTQPLLPFQARDIIRKIQDKSIIASPEALFLECIAVTPNFHRITERYHRPSNTQALTFDDRTWALQRLLNNIEAVKRAPTDMTTLNHAENLACTFGALVSDYFEASKLTDEKPSHAKFTRNVNSRLRWIRETILEKRSSTSKVNTGLRWVKETLLGKRSDLSFRMIAIGDPNIALDEISIPCDIAEKLTIDETVNFLNWGKLKEYIDHILPKHWLRLIRRNGSLLKISHSNQLQVGDTIYRELKDGDLVLVNRPPSVHRHSIIALRAKLEQFKSVVAINPVVCAPFGADFDGDCLDCFIPKSVMSIAEASELMTLSQQMINSQGGQALLAVTHDSLLAASMITSSDIFIDKFQMEQLQLFCYSSVPNPAIVKAPMLKSPLWTGKQLFSMLLPKGLNYKHSRNGVVISDGELLLCSCGSDWLQNSCDSIFHALCKECPSRALDYLCCAQSVLNEWISMNAFSVSLSDIYLASDSSRRIKMIDEVTFGLLEAKQSSYFAQTIYDYCARQMLVSGEHQCLSDYWKNVRMRGSETATLSKEATQEFKNVYSDIIKVVAEHIEKDNAMLAMSKAGSKGSLQKLVQQGACLGMQMYREEESFPFEIPQKLCSSQWICHSVTVKYDRNASPYLRDLGSMEKWYSRGLVENSFSDGLNPIEYFLHGVSSRGNSFEHGAEIPGQIFRKLMFFMRDIYIAYDGTVRNLYGKQIMQFSYGEFGQNNPKTAGEPVGALAASSLGEVAYSLLERQFKRGEDHPLHILKESLSCRPHRQNGHANERVKLRLSKKLRRIYSGLEYGAIKVKECLEKVTLCELTKCIRVMYENPQKSRVKRMQIQMPVLCPWVPHFLLCKETMKRKKLSVDLLIRVLNREYKSLRKKCSGLNLPALSIDCRSNCHFHVSEKEDKATLCLVFLTEISSATVFQNDGAYSTVVTNALDLIRDLLIPKLLDVVVKGNAKIDSINIAWEENMLGNSGGKNAENGELVITAISSRVSKAGELWNIVLNACEAIMDLIDWQRSGPESIYEVWHSMGVEAARKCCLQRLQHVVRVADKAIYNEHLCLVVDCLSLTGVFHGLTPTGLSKLLNQTSTSAPFVQGCFTKPKKNFFEAAKKGRLDNLAGTLDSLAWGKIASIGTGSFDILLNEKNHEPMKSTDVCDFLNAIKNEEVLVSPDDSVESSQHINLTENLESVLGITSSTIHLNEPKDQEEVYGCSPSLDLRNITNSHLSGKNNRETSGFNYWENGTQEVGEVEPELPPGFEPYKMGSFRSMLQKDKSKTQDNIIRETERCQDEFFENGHSRVLKRSKCAESIKQWKCISLLFDSLRTILHKRYKFGETLFEKDKSIVMEALRYHPQSTAKIGIGVQQIKIGCNPEFPESRCFLVVRKDGSTEDFSFHKCLKGLAARLSPSLAAEYQWRFSPRL